MGYSTRYHAVSLAAVFIALAIGILIGAALGSDVVSGTAEGLEDSLRSDLEDAIDQVGALQEDVASEREFADRVFPFVVDNRLLTFKVALIGIGDVPDDVKAQIERALEPSGAEITEVAVVRQPADADGLIAALGSAGEESGAGSAESQAAASGDATAPADGASADQARSEDLRAAAKLSGRLLARGGARFDDVREVLLSRYSGHPGEADGAIVVRYRPDGMAGRELADAELVEAAVIEGLLESGIRVIGAERSDDQETSIAYFRDHGLPTVDNVDLAAGKVSLVLELDGADGDFGVKETASGGLLPDLLGSTTGSGSLGP